MNFSTALQVIGAGTVLVIGSGLFIQFLILAAPAILLGLAILGVKDLKKLLND